MTTSPARTGAAGLPAEDFFGERLAHGVASFPYSLKTSKLTKSAWLTMTASIVRREPSPSLEWAAMMWTTSCGRPYLKANAAPEIGMAEELALAALDEDAVLAGVFEELADVVEDRPGQEDVAVDLDLALVALVEDLADPQGRLRHRPGVLDEVDVRPS